jgi:hypothetical protein
MLSLQPMVFGWSEHSCWCSHDFHLSNTNLATNSIPCFISGTFWFHNSRSSNRNVFLADLSAAQSATQGALVESTNQKQTLAWNRFRDYLLSIGCQGDPFSNSSLHLRNTKFLQHSLTQSEKIWLKNFSTSQSRISQSLPGSCGTCL